MPLILIAKGLSTRLMILLCIMLMQLLLAVPSIDNIDCVLTRIGNGVMCARTMQCGRDASAG